MRKRVLAYFYENFDEDYKAFNENLIPGPTPIIGVRIPVLNAFAKSLSEEERSLYLKEMAWEFHEEEVLNGMVIGKVKGPAEEVWPLIWHHANMITNWASCDASCARLKIVKNHREDYWLRLTQARPNTTMAQRFIIVMLKTYYLEEPYFEQVFAYLKKVNPGDYYVDMAIAWTLAEMVAKDAGQTLDCLKVNGAFSEAIMGYFIQKCRDSRRISPMAVEEILNYVKK